MAAAAEGAVGEAGLGAAHLPAQVLVQVVHGARLDHGEAELVVAAPVAVAQLHGEGDGLGARTPVSVVSSVIPQVVLGLGTGMVIPGVLGAFNQEKALVGALIGAFSVITRSSRTFV